MRERLIGAAVVVVAAIILIPWLVSRAHHPREVVSRLPVPASATDGSKSYVLPLPASGPPPASGRAVAAMPASRAASQAPPKPVHETAPAQPARHKDASSASTPAPGWTVQVASFSKRGAAAPLVKRLGKAGFKAFIDPHQVGGTTYYRVRVGPYRDEAKAKAAAPRIAAVSGTKVLVRQQGSGKQ